MGSGKKGTTNESIKFSLITSLAGALAQSEADLGQDYVSLHLNCFGVQWRSQKGNPYTNVYVNI